MQRTTVADIHVIIVIVVIDSVIVVVAVIVITRCDDRRNTCIRNFIQFIVQLLWLWLWLLYISHTDRRTRRQRFLHLQLFQLRQELFTVVTCWLCWW